MFGELGCLVIHSDDQVKDAYKIADVLRQLRDWWGDEVFLADGAVNRRAIALKIFSDPVQKSRLEQLLHPIVKQARDKIMSSAANNPQIAAFVWDTPLLCETGIYRECDTIVFVQANFGMRLSRVRQSRGWDEAELARRENLQWGLDKKKEISEYVIDNTADAEYARGQVKEVLSRILARYMQKGPDRIRA